MHFDLIKDSCIKNKKKKLAHKMILIKSEWGKVRLSKMKISFI